ncbi:hypothetical protein QOT17_017755 [Balamuthia mandrillaris]
MEGAEVATQRELLWIHCDLCYRLLQGQQTRDESADGGKDCKHWSGARTVLTTCGHFLCEHCSPDLSTAEAARISCPYCQQLSGFLLLSGEGRVPKGVREFLGSPLQDMRKALDVFTFQRTQQNRLVSHLLEQQDALKRELSSCQQELAACKTENTQLRSELQHRKNQSMEPFVRVSPETKAITHGAGTKRKRKSPTPTKRTPKITRSWLLSCRYNPRKKASTPGKPSYALPPHPSSESRCLERPRTAHPSQLHSTPFATDHHISHANSVEPKTHAILPSSFPSTPLSSSASFIQPTIADFVRVASISDDSPRRQQPPCKLSAFVRKPTHVVIARGGVKPAPPPDTTSERSVVHNAIVASSPGKEDKFALARARSGPKTATPANVPPATTSSWKEE